MHSLDKSQRKSPMPRSVVTTTTSRKPPAKARAHRDLTAFERFVERSDIKVDVAACIRWFWFGLAAFVTALTGLIIAIYSVPGAQTAKAKTPIVERALVIADKVAKSTTR